jgi:tungstate transport system substrate-binding protein
LVEGDPVLFNPYGVITVNAEKCPNVNAALGEQFVEWLVSVPAQEQIGAYGVEEFGQALFTPNSTAWNHR